MLRIVELCRWWLTLLLLLLVWNSRGLLELRESSININQELLCVVLLRETNQNRTTT